MWHHLTEDGRIPAGTECPFIVECIMSNDCNHTGKQHPVDFSCGAARLFDIYERESL